VAPLERLLNESEAQRHFALILFEVFAIAALLLSAIGVYGVLSSGVTDRLRELGIRSALGASRRDILSLVIRQGMLLAACGAAIGLCAAAASSRTVETLLFGISRLDAVTYAAVIVLVLAVSLMACLGPALRAAWVDPSLTLRSE
jgi:putative ABC transport system permease protein